MFVIKLVCSADVENKHLKMLPNHTTLLLGTMRVRNRVSRGRGDKTTDFGFKVARASVQDLWTVLIIFIR